jgi:hypothetical protein
MVGAATLATYLLIISFMTTSIEKLLRLWHLQNGTQSLLCSCIHASANVRGLDSNDTTQ